MIPETQAVNCVKLNMYPDGGIVSRPLRRVKFFADALWFLTGSIPRVR